MPDARGAVHDQWNGGAMDGFYTNAGIWALGYYTAEDLPFYYSLHDDSTLCVNFFCSVLGPTWPNWFYLAAGTSGGITTNGLWGYGIFDYPIILDLLDAAGVTLEGLQPRAGTASRTGTPTTCSCSGRSTPMTSERLAARAHTSTTCARADCPRCRSSSRAMPVAGTSIRPPTSRDPSEGARSAARCSPSTNVSRITQ